jgi:hypothetical protein
MNQQQNLPNRRSVWGDASIFVERGSIASSERDMPSLMCVRLFDRVK